MFHFWLISHKHLTQDILHILTSKHRNTPKYKDFPTQVQ